MIEYSTIEKSLFIWLAGFLMGCGFCMYIASMDGGLHSEYEKLQQEAVKKGHAIFDSQKKFTWVE